MKMKLTLLIISNFLYLLCVSGTERTKIRRSDDECKEFCRTVANDVVLRELKKLKTNEYRTESIVVSEQDGKLLCEIQTDDFSFIFPITKWQVLCEDLSCSRSRDWDDRRGYYESKFKCFAEKKDFLKNKGLCKILKKESIFGFFGKQIGNLFGGITCTSRDKSRRLK
jgi:hypothetical protein